MRQQEQAVYQQAAAFVGWIVADPTRLHRFMALTGWQPDDLRAGLDSAELAEAVIDHLMRDEAQLLMACRDLALPPETPARLQQALLGVPENPDTDWS